MNAPRRLQGPDTRIPYALTDAGRRVVDEMLAEHPRATAESTRRERAWALTDAALALLDSETS